MDVVLLTAAPLPDEITGGHIYNGEMVRRATHHGVTVRVIAISGKTFVARALAARRALRDAASADAIVVDSIVAAPVALAGPIATRLIGLAHQAPGGTTDSPLTRARAALDRAGYRRCELVIAVSEWIAARLRADSVRSVVVEPGVDRATATARDKSSAVALILCVANWVPHKGIVDLLDAFAQLPEDAAVLHLVGATHLTTRYGHRVAARLAREDLRQRVVPRGTLDRAAVANAFAAADVFALASRDEAYGIAFAEALAFGLPIVAYRSGNVPALLAGAGVLVEPGDVEALAWSLCLLTMDRDHRAAFAAKATARGSTLATWDESASAFFSAVRGTPLAPKAEHDDRARAASSA